MHSEALVNERKFTAHSLDADRALAIVRHFCSPDPIYPCGQVNSIYFDMPCLSCFKEKIEGDTIKRKYRLRWYNVPSGEPDQDIPAFLEVKYRYGSARDKIRNSIMVPRSMIEYAPLHSPELLSLLDCHRSGLADNIPLPIVPVVCISYMRHRYNCDRTGIVVCVDHDIRASRFNCDILPQVPLFSLNVVVCEFKGGAHVSLPWANHLYQAGFRVRSFSKYGECIHQALYGGAPTVIRMSI